MYIYNITTKVSWSIQEDWVKWMKETHIPEIMQTGCFTEHRFVQLLETDESEGPTYATQFHAPSLEDYNMYLSQFAPALRSDAIKKWGDHFIGFRSLMKLVH